MLNQFYFKLFEETSYSLLYNWLHQFTLPPNMYEYSLFSMSLSTLITWLVDHSYSDGYEVTSHCGFDLHFPHDYWCWLWPVDHLYIFLEKRKSLFKSFAHFLVSFCYWVAWITWIFWILSSYQICGLQIFSPVQ